MARIPVYERRVAQESNAPIARFSGGSPIAAALQNIGQAGTQVADRMMAADNMAADKAKREAEEVDKAQVANLLSNGQVYWQQREDERRQAWKVGDPDMREQAGKEFDKWVAESAKALNTEDGRRYFQQHAAGMKSRLLTDAYSYQRRATTEKINAENIVGENNDEILVSKAWRDPAEVNAIIARRLEPLLARTDLSEADKIKEAERIKGRMFLARERAYVENDPAGWLRENGGTPKAGAPAGAPRGWSVTGGSPSNTQGMTEGGNIDLTRRPTVKNNDGSISTVRSISVNIDGAEVLLPTVIGDKVVSDQEAIKHYRETGQHLGKFKTPQAADAYAETLHKQQEAFYSSGQVGTSKPGQAAPIDVLFAAVVGQESGGVHTKGDGTLLTSPKGALGITQVMPKTGQDPGYGVRPLQNQSRKEYLRFGRDYLQAMLREFGGDQAKALAAYNAGPDTVAEAVKARGVDWLTAMPSETKNYVASISKKVGASAAPAAAPSEVTGWASQHLDPDKVYQLRNLAETRIGQQQSQYRAEATRLVSDYMAAHKDGKVEAQPLVPDYFDRAFGAEGPRLYSEYVQSRDMGRDIQSFKAMPVQQIEAVVNAAIPAEAGPGYAGADARANVRRQAAMAVLAQREKDPVSYVASNSPRVQALQQQVAAAQDPAQRRSLNEQMVEASLAEQQRLGIQNQRILSPGQADRWASQAMKASRPEDAANLIAALEMEYGQRNFPKVFSELAREGKISGELLIIPNLPSQAARESVSRLARVKEQDLAGATSADQQKIVKEKSQEAVIDLVRTVPFMTDASVGMVSSYEQMLRKMAYEQVAAGKSPGDAVEASRKMLIGHYEFRDTVRYPKGMDYRKVERGMEHVLMRQLDGIDVPPDAIGARKPEEARKAYTEVVKDRPLWHTTDDDKGVRLFVVREDGVKMPVTRGGKPLTFTWEQLQAPIDARAAGRPATAVEATKALGRPVTSYDVDRLAYERMKNAPR